MAETVAPSLEQLKEEARRRRAEAVAREAEVERLEAEDEAREWRRVLEAVGRDHPQLAGLIDPAAVGFSAPRDFGEPDGSPPRDEATLYARLPGHEPVALKYVRGPDGAWKQGDFGRPSDRWRVAVDWQVAPDVIAGVENADWSYSLHLGEALLVAEVSNREKSLQTREALRLHDRKLAETRRGKAARASAEERLIDNLRDLVLEWASEAAEASDPIEF